MSHAMRTSLSTIAAPDASSRAQHGGEVHPVGFVTVAVHDEISHVRVQHVVEGQRNLFEMLGVVGRRAQHVAPPVAEGVLCGCGRR
jgi:hypothetical protein